MTALLAGRCVPTAVVVPMVPQNVYDARLADLAALEAICARLEAERDFAVARVGELLAKLPTRDDDLLGG